MSCHRFFTLAFLCLLHPLAVAVFAEEPGAPLSADQAWAKLAEGNKRFVANMASHPNQTAERREAVAKGQTPFVAVLCCADSRVAPEILFQGLGDLFVVRNAGNVFDDHVLGSLEFAVEQLKVPLIVVLGHDKCGAVAAAVSGAQVEGHLHSVMESLQAAVAAAREQHGDNLQNTILANVHGVAEILDHAKPFLGQAVQSGKLKVVGACYRLESGAVEVVQ